MRAMINNRLLFLYFLLLFINSAKAQERLIDDGNVLKIGGGIITLEAGTPVKARTVENPPQVVPTVPVMGRISGSGFYYREEIEPMAKRYQDAAEKGDPEAQFGLAATYHNTELSAESVDWFRKSAEQGYAPAQVALGDCYLCGRDVPKDETEAFNWFLTAAEQENTQGQIRVANAYLQGQGVPEDKTEAVKWYRKAAEQGSAEAQFALGNCYAKGEGVHEDKEEAIKWYHQAVEREGHEKQWFQHRLANIYFNGEGLPQNKTEAIKWYRKAADGNLREAQYQLADCYFNGDGVLEDKEEAVQWLIKVVENGPSIHEKAEYALGNCYFNGIGIAPNKAEAVKHYLKAAERYHEPAHYALGKCYLDGEGVLLDRARAIAHLRRARSIQEAADLLKKLKEESFAEHQAIVRGDYVPVVIELENSGTECIRSVAFSPDGTKAFAADALGRSVKVRIYDAQTGQFLKLLESKAEPLNNYVATMRRGAWSSDGKKIAIAASDGTARIWDVESGKELYKLTGHMDEVHSAAFSPDGKKVVTASKDGTARIWDTESGKELRQMDEHKHGPVVIDGATGQRVNERRIHAVHHAVFSADGKKIVTAGFDYTVRIWDAESGKELQVLHHGPGYIVQSAAFSPDDKKVLASGTGGTVQIWDAASGEELTRLGEYGLWVFSAAFSPDGTKIVSSAAGMSNTVCVWNVETGKALLKIDRHAGETVFDVAWSPDGKRIITAGGNGTVLMIDLERLAELERESLAVRPSATDFW